MGTVLLHAGVYGKAASNSGRCSLSRKDDEDARSGLPPRSAGKGTKTHPAKFDEAQKTLEGVLVRDPHNVEAGFNLGILLSDFLKKPNEAKPLFQSFPQDAPSDHPARAEADRQMKSMAQVASEPRSGK